MSEKPIHIEIKGLSATSGQDLRPNSVCHTLIEVEILLPYSVVEEHLKGNLTIKQLNELINKRED